jgi:two-component system aerobic respiration control sensor histidine kinase ArcB
MFDPDEFDLVLLDIQLPDMTGLDIARQLRERYSDQALPPLIALTANVLKDKKEYLEAGMDDVLSKPLSVPALTRMINHYWGHQPVPSIKTDITTLEQDIIEIDESLLDTAMLEQYLELVGPQLIYQSLEMFEQMMPSYLELLDSNMTARDQQGITEEGHKIKGAAGSVGLKHLQQLAQHIQTPDLPAWWNNLNEWVEELKQEWRNDVAVLRTWVDKAEKK